MTEIVLLRAITRPGKKEGGWGGGGGGNDLNLRDGGRQETKYFLWMTHSGLTKERKC